MKRAADLKPISPLEGEMSGRTEGGYACLNAGYAKAKITRLAIPYRLKLPKIPRTRARPISLATLLEIERAALFIAASITVSRW
ncbi:hypothetical protein SAMN05880593_11290 [Rhizobium sp. RU36D]|nr:hypothetical protein SAMN05880593_11290 [Rhizobium sp. RU36D]